MEKLIFTGGSDWSIEFSTPDCQHGWSILKGGTGQSIGCYLTKEEAEKALEGLNTNGIDILGAGNSQAAQSPSEVAQVKKTIWDGVFVPSDKGQMGPDFNTEFQDARYYFPSKATYENDGKPAAGYGNSSSNNHTP